MNTSPPRMNQWVLLFTAIGLTACSIRQVQTVQKVTASAPADSAATRKTIQTEIEALISRVKRELVPLPAGSFEMGDWGSEEGLPYDMDHHSKPLHKVTLDGFWMMAYKVTYEDFDLFTQATGEQLTNQDAFSLKYRSPRKPTGVNWFGAKAYCQWLGRLSGMPFDLPTEAQWEYAARSGGKRLLFATDNGSIDMPRNYPDDWKLKDRRVQDIGSYPPNPAGLYGMLDYKATEWVNDWYDPDYYKHSPEHNPRGPEIGKPALPDWPQRGPAKVIRGTESSPYFGGFVFSRMGNEPRRIDVNGAVVQGYSGSALTQFRCAVNSPSVTR